MLEVWLGLFITLICPGLAGGVWIEGVGLGGWESGDLKLGTFSRTFLGFLNTIGVFGLFFVFFEVKT